MNEKKGITLISLVLTIIILLILVGISISELTKENGILSNANYTREETRGASVEEEKNLWEVEQEANKYIKNKTTTLKELLNKLVDNKLLTEDEKDKIIGNDKKGIEGTGEITIGSRTIVFDDNIMTLEKIKLQCEIDKSYTINDIAENKGNSLEKVLEKSEATKYIVNNYIDNLVLVEQAMTLLGKNNLAINIIIESDELCEKVVNSEYRKSFCEYIVYNKDTLIGTARGRGYYKYGEGFSLGGAVSYVGEISAGFFLVGKDENAISRLFYV